MIAVDMIYFELGSKQNSGSADKPQPTVDIFAVIFADRCISCRKINVIGAVNSIQDITAAVRTHQISFLFTAGCIAHRSGPAISPRLNLIKKFSALFMMRDTILAENTGTVYSISSGMVRWVITPFYCAARPIFERNVNFKHDQSFISVIDSEC